MIPSAAVVRTGLRLAGTVPAPWLHAIARVAGHIGTWTLATRRATIRGNLVKLQGNPAGYSRVMPNLLEAAVDLWRLPSLEAEGVRALVRAEGLAHLDAAMQRGRGVVLATAHLGPYELAGAWLAAAGYQVHAMVESLDAATVETLAVYRGATGMQLIDRRTGTRAVLRALRAGDAVALVCDRMVGEGAPGMVVPMGFGWREVPTGPAAFALTTGAAIVTGHIVRDRTGPARYVMHLEAPLLPDGHTPASLTQAVAARLNAAIVAHATEWYVFQPAWREQP